MVECCDICLVLQNPMLAAMKLVVYYLAAIPGLNGALLPCVGLELMLFPLCCDLRNLKFHTGLGVAVLEILLWCCLAVLFSIQAGVLLY